MTDLIERLRAYDNNGTASWSAPREAVDEIERLKKKLAASQAMEAKLRDFAQWLTGCCDLTQYDYFIQNRHILAEQQDDTALKEFKRKVLLEAADGFGDSEVIAILRRMAEE